MPKDMKTKYDYMRQCENSEEDAMFPEEWAEDSYESEKQKYFDFYDDIKTKISEDW